jgi:hypothetical protein
MHPDMEAELRVLAEQDVMSRSKHAVKDQAAVEARLLELVEIPEEDRLTIHDLRRTVGSQMAKYVAPMVIGKALRNPSAVGVYARIGDGDARAALQDHAKRDREVGR